jgi:hypothetical protein
MAHKATDSTQPGAPAEKPTDITGYFEAIRQYAREHQQSVLEVIAEYALADLPMSIGQMIKDYLEERKPKVKPGEVQYRTFFSSGRSDISERMEEIIYGPESGDDKPTI